VPGRLQERELVKERDARVARPSQARREQPSRARVRQLSQAARQPSQVARQLLPAQPVQPLLARAGQPSREQEHSALALWQLASRAQPAVSRSASVEQQAREQADDFEEPLTPRWALRSERWE
jgi:hypothetical protein